MNAEDEDKTVVVSRRVEPGEKFSPIPGSMKWQATCGHEVWLSLSSQRFLVQEGAGGEVDVLCAECALKYAQEEQDE